MFEKKTKKQILELADKGSLSGKAFLISNDDYHSLNYVNASMIKKAFSESPRAAKAVWDSSDSKMQRGKPGTLLTALGFGSAFHKLILEPNDFFDEFSWHDEPVQGTTIIGAADKKMLSAMEHNLIMHDTVWNDCTSVGWPEVAMFWKCQLTGLMCKAKADWLNPTYGIVDLKTTKDAPTKYNLLGAIKNFQYDFQAYHYLKGLQACFPDTPRNFMFVFSSKADHHDSGSVYYGLEAAAKITVAYTDILCLLSQCITLDEWPGVSKEPLVFEGIER